MKILRVLLYLLYLGAFALAVDYVVFWRPFVAELRERERPGNLQISDIGVVPKELIERVGTLAQDRASSFTHFEEQKSPGVTRVCAFGDSFTYGDEVAEDGDYPSRLDHALRGAGIQGVEVLNFGSPWHGFHQSVLLWEEAGGRYACDLTLLGPASFWELRDTTFNHSNLISPYYLHARYVLEQGDVRLLGVLGGDFGERFDRYWSFFPRWRYLRYDRNPPAFLLAPIPEGRTLRNPFYYRRDSAEAEAMATWRILLTRMAARGKPVILTGLRDDIVEMARSIENPHLQGVSAWREHRFPYRARQGHFSVWGNQMVAAQFGELLLGGPPGSADTFCANLDVPACRERSLNPIQLVTSGHGEHAKNVRVPARRSLADYASIAFQIAGEDAGVLVTASPDFWARGQGTRAGFYRSDRVALIAIVSKQESLVDAAFLPLRFPVKDGEPLQLRVGESETRPSVVRLLHPMLPLGVVESESLAFRAKEELVWVGNVSDGSRVEVLLGGRTILEGEARAGEAVLRAVDGDIYQVVATRRKPIDVAALPSAGTVDLLLEHPTDGAQRVPLSRWRKIPVSFPPAD